MAEYINKEILLDYLYSKQEENIDVMKEIADFPSSVVLPIVHGRWVFDGCNEYYNHYHCDKCGKDIVTCNEIYTEPTPNYCPICGAKMDLE